MPELPEVEVLVRHLGPLLKNKTVRRVTVRRAKVLAGVSLGRFGKILHGARFTELTRRGKYLLFNLLPPNGRAPLSLVGHLGMTGRMFLQPATQPLPKHTAVAINLGSLNLVFEDQRYFGRLMLDHGPLDHLGPEPLGKDFTVEYLGRALGRSAQAIKVKLLNQSLVAGIGNIYASEVLFQAGISPRLAARRLSGPQVERLWQAVRTVLAQAIEGGSTVPLDWAGNQHDHLFYFGRAANAPDYYTERLQVYDRQGQPCLRCGTAIERVVQAARSTYFCPRCQRSG